MDSQHCRESVLFALRPGFVGVLGSAGMSGIPPPLIVVRQEHDIQRPRPSRRGQSELRWRGRLLQPPGRALHPAGNNSLLSGMSANVNNEVDPYSSPCRNCLK